MSPDTTPEEAKKAEPGKEPEQQTAVPPASFPAKPAQSASADDQADFREEDEPEEDEDLEDDEEDENTGKKKKKRKGKGEDDEEGEDGKPKNIMERIKSTVRQRKRNDKATTQRYIPIAEIRNDTVVLKNGGLRAAMLVDPLNFNLKSETEQEGIIAGYQNFLNTLTFPVQIVIRSTKVNIDPYIEQIRKRAETQKNELLQQQALMYAAFIEKLVDVADIMQKRFYVVVPQDDNPPKQNTMAQFFTWMKTDDSASKISQRNRRFHQRSILLRDRINLVQSGLHNVGLVSHRLSTQELIELYYEMYNPLTSQEQKLSADMNTEEMTL